MQGTASAPSRRRGGRPCPPRMTAAPLTYPTSAGAEPPLFCLRRVTFVSCDKSHQKRRLKLRFKTSSRASAVISRRPVPRATDFPVFPGSKDCASTAFRDALSRDAAPCRGGCLGALPRGYRQIFHHDGRLRPPRMTAAPRVRQGGLTLTERKRSRPGGEIFRPADGKPLMAYRVYVEAG